ncbi:MAG: glyoxalase [Myxococcales bacterium]|nr:glyoxalase [Myxococcales bacterium]
MATEPMQPAESNGSSTPPSTQRIVPMLAYRDAPKAIDFLSRAFGFEEKMRMDMPDGRVGHAELGLGGHIIMLASVWDEGGLAAPFELPAAHCQIYCVVADVDAHHERARAAGGTIVAAPADQPYGMRMYRVNDPEGHRWIFATAL